MTRLIAAALAVLAACAGGGTSSPPPPAASVGSASSGVQLSVTMGQIFPLHMGQAASVAGVSSLIRLRSVANDSRCPAGTQCVQAGNAEVTFDVTVGSAAPTSVTLNTATPPRETALGNGILRLMALSPTPLAGSTIDPSTYVATLCVCRQ